MSIISTFEFPFLTELIFVLLTLKSSSKSYFIWWHDKACTMMLFHKVYYYSWCNILNINYCNSNNKKADLVLAQDTFLLENAIFTISIEKFIQNVFSLHYNACSMDLIHNVQWNLCDEISNTYNENANNSHAHPFWLIYVFLIPSVTLHQSFYEI